MQKRTWFYFCHRTREHVFLLRLRCFVWFYFSLRFSFSETEPHCVGQTGLELVVIPLSVSQVQRLYNDRFWLFGFLFVWGYGYKVSLFAWGLFLVWVLVLVCYQQLRKPQFSRQSQKNMKATQGCGHSSAVEHQPTTNGPSFYPQCQKGKEEDKQKEE